MPERAGDVTDAGYTLGEMLVAIFMLGLATAGYAEGVQVLTRWEMATNKVATAVQATRTAQARLDRLFEGQGPFRSDSAALSGDGAGLQFSCGGTTPCGLSLAPDGQDLQVRFVNGSAAAASVRLTGLSGAYLAYQGSAGPASTWPPVGPLQRLQSLSLMDAAGQRPVLVEHVWSEEPGLCAFDVVMQDCR